ncbi:MAG: hypothetical protein HZA51_13405 [Planctomycetes bacterium]|nr:hypothetical protein [Planctomycetota bacterium]
MGTMFEALGRSRVLELFDETISSPRRYVNSILDRFVIHLANNARFDRLRVFVDGDVAVQSASPERRVALAELEAICAERLGDCDDKGEPDQQADCSGNALYVRKHRERRRKWETIKDLFPDLPFRPRRRWKKKGKKKAANGSTGPR